MSKLYKKDPLAWSIYYQLYRLDNQKKIQILRKRSYQKNRKREIATVMAWQVKNRDRWNEYQKEYKRKRSAEDPIYKAKLVKYARKQYLAKIKQK